MTFSYTPAGGPAIWMQFVPARENTVRPAEEDNRLTEGMVHSGMANETTCVEEEVSTAAEDISENSVSAEDADTHILSVDQESQLRASQLRPSRLAECEYQRDCDSVGKKQADGLSGNSFDFLILTTTTDRGRDAVVVEMRKSAGHSGSRNERLAPALCGQDRMLRIRQDVDSKETCRVASGPDGKNGWNNRLRCQKIAWLYCPSQVADSDELGPPPMTKTGPRRLDRVMSSQRSSNLHDDSNKTAASMDSRLRGNDELGYCRNTAF